MSFEFKPDAILPEVIHVRPRRFGDSRGWFAETFRADAFAAAGIEGPFVQDNHSRSAPAGTIRGLHFQAEPNAQGKLVRCVRGRMLDVAVDIRPQSPGFGRVMQVELDAASGAMVFIPRGFAHGFCTLEDGVEVVYKTDAYYAPEQDRGIAHDDPAIGIDWPYPPEARTLSDKDRALPTLRELFPPVEAGVSRS